MNIDGLLNRWGKGQLLAYSGLNGKTDYDGGLVLRSRNNAAFDIELPGEGSVTFREVPPDSCFFSSDSFELDGVRGAMSLAPCHIVLRD